MNKKQKGRVAVIGAGVSGMLCACLTAKKGYDVTVYDKQQFPPVNPSTIAGGMMSPLSEIETLPLNYTKVGMKGIEIWSEILGRESEVFFKKNGSLIVSYPQDRHLLDRFAEHLPGLSASWRWVNEKYISELEPDLKGRFQRGIFIPEEAHILPVQALEALAQILANTGGRINIQEVNPHDLEDEYDWVIDCRGYVPETDSNLRGVKGEILIVRNREVNLSRPVRLMHPRYPLYVVPRPGNVYAIGATAIEGAEYDDGKVLVRSAMELLSAACAIHPSFAEASILEMMSGVRAAYIDNLPRIKAKKETKSIRANGLFRHGYLLAPVMASSIAHYIETQEYDDDYPLFSGQLNNHP